MEKKKKKRTYRKKTTHKNYNRSNNIYVWLIYTIYSLTLFIILSILDINTPSLKHIQPAIINDTTLYCTYHINSIKSWTYSHQITSCIASRQPTSQLLVATRTHQSYGLLHDDLLWISMPTVFILQAVPVFILYASAILFLLRPIRLRLFTIR